VREYMDLFTCNLFVITYLYSRCMTSFISALEILSVRILVLFYAGLQVRIKEKLGIIYERK
jgi:hypothetical protein